MNLNTRDFFWLNINSPGIKDFKLLSDHFHVYGATLDDIREEDNSERIDNYQDYIFISICPFTDSPSRIMGNIKILIFSNAIVTLQNYSEGDLLEIVNFIHIISSIREVGIGWILFGIFMTILEDGKRRSKELIEIIDQMIEERNKKLLNKAFGSMHILLRLVQQMEPKKKILQTMKKIPETNSIFEFGFKEVYDEFHSVQKKVEKACSIYERLQNTILAMEDITLSEQSAVLNDTMKKIAVITLVVTPIQVISGIWGMNVKLPGRDADNFAWFWGLSLAGPLMALVYYTYICIINRKNIK